MYPLLNPVDNSKFKFTEDAHISMSWAILLKTLSIMTSQEDQDGRGLQKYMIGSHKHRYSDKNQGSEDVEMPILSPRSEVLEHGETG